MVGVFLPTVPPTTGYVVYTPKSKLVVLDMSVEDAAKLLLSAGLVMPEYRRKTEALAQAAGAAPTVAAAGSLTPEPPYAPPRP